MAFFVRFSTRGVQKHYKKLCGENPCQKLLAEKVEEKKNSCRLFPSICFIAFLAISLHEELNKYHANNCKNKT
jgi:hypothetical protein